MQAAAEEMAIKKLIMKVGQQFVSILNKLMGLKVNFLC